MLAGVFLALQINYKWEIRFIGSILKWHVETGIAMGVTGIFHFLWHLSYYTGMFKKEEKVPVVKTYPEIGSAVIPLNLFVVGFISSSFQLLLIREMMNITGGYELITGTFLASWLITSALGAVIAGKSQLYNLKKINIIFSFSPLVSVLMLILLSRLFLSTGEIPSFLGGLIFTFLVLIPFCLMSGFTFVKLISAAGISNRYTPGRSFAVETVGGIVSGIAVALFSAGILHTWQMILILIVSGFTFVLLSFFIRRRTGVVLLKTAAMVILTSVIVLDPDNLFRSLLLKGINISESRDTPYGNIVRGEYGGEESIYYNQRLIKYHGNTVEIEENIHYAMLQSRTHDNILLVSGSINAHIEEILKYPVKEVVYVERDPALMLFEEQPAVGESVLLRIENDDAYSYIRDHGKKFDVVILLLPPPSSLLLNKYYTLEFFSSIRERLNPGGIFMCSPGVSKTYYNEESLMLYSCVFNTLSEVFGNVLPVEGHKLYLLASDGVLSAAICDLAAEHNINNVYVSPDYLADDLIEARTDELISLIDRNVKINRTMLPIACFYYQSYNLSRNINERIPAIILIVTVFIPPLFMIRKKNLIMYSAASALAGFEIVILLVLQLTAGNMYQLTGLIIAGLMAGLAFGAGFNLKPLASLSLILNSLILLIFYLLAALMIPQITAIRSVFLVSSLLVLLIFIPSLITGHLFRSLTTLRGPDADHNTSAVYSADLAGSALGFILISGLIVPAFGITVSILIISAMVLTGFLAGLPGNQR